jgi:hypothetical protein
MSIFNQPLHPKVASTLARRQNIIGKEIRSPKELAFLNSTTSWVKLSSSVNVNNEPGLALNNILQGGTLNSNTFSTAKQREGIGEGITNAYSLKNSNGSSNLLGVKPMPGITSVSIDNIGAYGSLRKATINFQCWDIKQLEILETLYMRPGYTLLLEFGRTTYIDDKDKLITVNDDKDFFNKNGINNLQEYLNSLYAKSVNQEGNYDAFFGYITNYAWSARSDGGYDCKTELISTGELLESLKINYSFAGAINYQSLATDSTNPKFKGLLLPSLNFPKDSGPTSKDITRLNNEYAENIISGLMYEVYLACFYNEQSLLYRVTPFMGTNPQTKNLNFIVNNVNININYGVNRYKSTADPTDPKKQFLIGDTNIYITLESFCQLFTNFILPKVFDSEGKSKGNLLALSTTDRTYPKFSFVGSPLLCLYNQLILSTNPDVCWIKNDEWGNVIKGQIIESKVGAIKISSAPDPDISGHNDIKKLVVGWIKQLLNKTDSQKVLTNIETFVSSKTGKEKETIQIINKSYIYLRGGKGFIQPNSKEVVNVDQYSWTFLKAFGVKKDDITILNNKYREKNNTFGDLIQATPGAMPTNKQFDLLNKLKTLPLETEQYVKEQQQSVNEAGQIEKQNQANKTELSNLSQTYEQLNNSFPQNFTTSGGALSTFGQIGNIYVNLKYLYNTAKDPGLLAQDQSSTGKLSASSFLKKLMVDIQTALCNVNQFELHIDPIDGIGRIIDLNYVNKDANQSLFQFEIGNNRSIVRELKLESQIFSDQSSIVAISAQQDAGKLGLNNSTLVGFNEGITDRNILKKDSYLNNIITDNREEERQRTIVLNYVSSLSFIVSEYLKNFLGKGIRTASGVTPAQIAAAELKKKAGLPGGFTTGFDTFTPVFTTVPADSNFDYSAALSYSNALRDIIYFFTSLNSFNTDNKGKSFIPTLLSMTIDGLGGFIIGNLFTVDSKFVPNLYKRGKTASYILTKVNHEIANNDWTTTISGYPFNLDSNTSEVKNISDFKVIVITDPNPVGTVNGNNNPGTKTSIQKTTFIDKLNNINSNNQTKYTIKGGVNTSFDPIFEDTAITILTKLAENPAFKNNQIIITGGRRPDDKPFHPAGKALDFSISGITDKGLAFENYLLNHFPLFTTLRSHWYGIMVNRTKVRFLNEYINPSEGATGPHFHIALFD